MVTSDPLLVVALYTVLFFFWAYGIVSFLLDLKNKIIPKTAQFLRGRRRLKEEKEKEEEREEREQQLY
jgi:hypothetical protein